MTRQEYMNQLKEKLSVFDDGLAKEILDDYEGHFREGLENGRSEQEICEELGTIDEIIEDLRQLYQPKKKSESSFNSTVNDVVNDALNLANNLTNTIVKGIKNGIDYGKRTMHSDWPKDDVVDTDCTKETSETCRGAVIEAGSADVQVSLSEDEKFHLEYINHGGLKDKMFYHFTGEQKGDTYYGRLVKEQGTSSLFSKLSTPDIDINIKIPKEFKLVEIRTTSGDIKVNEARVEEGRFYAASGDITINNYKGLRNVAESASGDIVIKHLKGEDIKIYSKSGDICLEACKSGTGECENSSGDIAGNDIKGAKFTAKSASGDIQLDGLASDLVTLITKSGDIGLKDSEVKELKIDTASGDTNIEKIKIEKINSESASGDIKIFANSGNYCIQSISGDIELCSEGSIEGTFKTTSGDTQIKMKNAEGGYVADVSAVSGDISLQFGSERKYEIRKGVYTMGDGKSKIKAESLSGDITIRA